MIIYDYSFQYRIKPFREITDQVELRDLIYDIKPVENIGNASIRLLLTVNSEEIVIHYPADVTDEILYAVEEALRSVHSKMSLFIADTIITLDILVSEIDDTEGEAHQFIIIDLISFNGIDYRSTELRTRRRLTKTFFQGFLSSPNLIISQPISVFNSQKELESSKNQSEGTTKEILFGVKSSESDIKEWKQIIIRNENSTYNDELNDEWLLIDVQSIPDDLKMTI